MSTVIKRGQAGQLVSRSVSLDLADHLAEADKVVAMARRQAAEMISNAQRQGREIRRQAQTDGFRQGRQEGFEEGKQAGHQQAFEEAKLEFAEKHADLTGSLAAALGEIERHKSELFIQAKRDLLDFAVALASRITHGVGRIHREMATAQVESALNLVMGDSDVAVHVNPKDVESLDRFAVKLANQARQCRHLSVVGDDEISPGGALLNAGHMEIDARVEIQLEQLTAILLGNA